MLLTTGNCYTYWIKNLQYDEFTNLNICSKGDNSNTSTILFTLHVAYVWTNVGVLINATRPVVLLLELCLYISSNKSFSIFKCHKLFKLYLVFSFTENYFVFYVKSIYVQTS
jgi:hypothetical protein